MDSAETQAIELTAVTRELLAAVNMLDESTKESTRQITAAIQRWT